MKLLSRSETKQAEQSSLDALLAKEAMVSNAISKKLKLLNELEEDYSARTEAKRKALAEAEAAFKQFMSSREQTVQILEERRTEALKPVEGLLASAKRTKELAEERLADLEKQSLEVAASLNEWKEKAEEADKDRKKAKAILAHAQEEVETKKQQAEDMKLEASRTLQVARDVLKEAIAQKELSEGLQDRIERERIGLEALKKNVLDEQKVLVREQEKLVDERNKLKAARLILEKRYGQRIA